MDKKKIEPSHGHEGFDKKYYRRFFDKYTKSEFDKYVNWAYGWIKFLDRYVDIKKGQGRTLLELGSSLGYFSRVFKDRGFRVSASDISSYIVKKAGSFQKDIKFFKLDFPIFLLSLILVIIFTFVFLSINQYLPTFKNDINETLSALFLAIGVLIVILISYFISCLIFFLYGKIKKKLKS